MVQLYKYIHLFSLLGSGYIVVLGVQYSFICLSIPSLDPALHNMADSVREHSQLSSDASKPRGHDPGVHDSSDVDCSWSSGIW